MREIRTSLLVSSKKFSYRRQTTRQAMSVNSCYVSQGTRVRKVSNSKSDLDSRVSASVPFDRPHISTISATLQLCLFCTIKMSSLISQNLTRSRHTSHITFRGVTTHVLVLCINQQTKFEVPSFTISKDMIGVIF